MAPRTEAQTMRLTGLLAQENSKKGYNQARQEQSKFRETALDTHEILPPQYFGPSRVPEKMYHGPSLGAQQREETRQRKISSASQRLAQEAPMFSSVFKPTFEQSHVTGLATMHRQQVAGSEWALLDTLEVAMFEHERQQKAAQVAAQQALSRQQLDAQVRLKDIKREYEMEETRVERQTILNTTAQIKEEERQAALGVRGRILSAKAEREAHMSETQRVRSANMVQKIADEREAVRLAKADLEVDRQKAVAKAEGRRQQNMREAADNESRVAGAVALRAQQRIDDEELSQQTIKTLEKQEADRAQARADHLDMLDRRARGISDKIVSQMVIKRAEDDRRRILAEEKAEEKAQRVDSDKIAKKAATKAMLLSDRQAFVKRKESQSAQRAADVAAENQQARMNAAEEEVLQAAKLRGIRDRAMDTASLQTTQRLDRENKSIGDGVNMSEEERRFNRRLLEQAEQVVGAPRQMAIYVP